MRCPYCKSGDVHMVTILKRGAPNRHLWTCDACDSSWDNEKHRREIARSMKKRATPQPQKET